MSSLICIAVLGFIVALAITPLIRNLAWRFNITDRPDGHRKLHDKPTPLGGGVTVFIGLWCALLGVAVCFEDARAALVADPASLASLLGASFLIVLVGLADDRYHLRGRHKLLGQFAAAAVLIASGLLIRSVQILDWQLDLEWFAYPFTVFWLVGAMNALNLLDGIDGLATTVGIILSLTIAAMAVLIGHPAEGLIMAALAGSLMGFLRYNFPPAKMFLGDAGSMLIGLIVGALAIRSTLKGPATVALAAPFAVWTIPILDSAAAILRRKLTGRSIYTTDRGHLHHRLLALSGSTPRTLIWIGLCCGITSVGALISLYMKNDLFALLSSFCVVAILVTSRVFGHVELLLLSSKLKTMGLSLFNPSRPQEGQARQAAIRLQGTRPWDQLWNSLIEFTEKFNLSSVRLDVNIPAFHEGYHASWASTTRHEPNQLWRTEIPLGSGEQVIGRLTICGSRDELPVCDVIDRLMDLLYPFEMRLLKLATSATEVETKPAAAVSLDTAPAEPLSGPVLASPVVARWSAAENLSRHG